MVLFPFGVQTQSNLDTVQTAWFLPSAWEGPEQIDAAGVAQTMPPFEVVVADGDFIFSRIDSDDHVRILPAANPASDDPRRLTLVWRVAGGELAAMAGNVVEVSLGSRAYSPPDGVELSITEGKGPDSSSSGIAINNVDWQTYSVARLVVGDAYTTTIGFDWQLPTGR